MGKIRILTDQLVSKIAAGEIVERPASVVKELLENSLDAGSTLIQIELRTGGKKLIGVSDNGDGMTRDDALLSLERHATSRIRDIKDLFSIRTLGFRGEALPSIASVSRFRLTTRTKDEIAGVRILVEGGTIKGVEETGCPQGTTVEVGNLFYNTPARLKFMKTTETELTNVLDIVQREALSRPGVGFEVLHEGETLIQLPQRKAIEERLSGIFPDVELFEVEAESEGIKVYGFMSNPGDTRSTTQKLYAYVNLRAVRDRFLTRMMIDSYGKLIERGKFPQGVLFIDIPSEEVDVNVHPTKNEVRFKRTKLVGDLIKASVFDMLRQSPWIKGYHQRIENAVQGFFERRASFEPIRLDGPKKASFSSHYSYEQENEPLKNITTSELRVDEPSSTIVESLSDSHETTSPYLFKKEGFFSELEIIGQLGKLYIICASKKGMILIDQHAAHERVNYEKLKNAYAKQDGLVKQELLIPLTIELSPYEAKLLEKHKQEIENLGIKLEEFGKDSFLIRSIPSILKNADVERLVKDVLGEIVMLGEGKSLEEDIDHVICTIACHSSVRASQELNQEKMRALLEELDRAEFPHSCPHGRPVASEITFQALEKMFKRS
ncbi:MAG: DNA mismatch repair endonuclease MutL [Deltaproteobacteria bacterium]|nr:DNA mismatch repair endonuclease MutL [Deltaproteobacteria bacterium]